MPPHRAKGSWAPRLAGVAVIVVVAGGAVGVYLGTSHAPHPEPAKHQHHALTVKVVSVQTVGVIDFGPYDDGDPWQNDFDDHPLMLLEQGSAVDFVNIPRRELSNGTPEWTANQLSDGSDIFIFVPSGKCLSAAGKHLLRLTHCDLSFAQRWRPVHSVTVLGEPTAQYANAKTGDCLTAPRKAGLARLSPCGKARTKDQEIAFWWSA